MDPLSPTQCRSIETADGLSLHTQQWRPDAPPRAVVALVHGYAEHCGRYGHVARALTGQGAAVFAYDQRGYGRSEGRRAYIDSFETYIDDLDLFLDSVQRNDPTLPVFLFGHSMGGLVVLKYLLDREVTPRGLMLSAPALEINQDLAPLLRRFAQVLGRLAPTLPTTRSPKGAISRDPQVVEAAKKDPLNFHGRVPARTGAEMLRAGAEVRSQLHAVTTPFLVLHGTADILANPEWSKRLYARASAEDKTLKLYENLYHETFNEPEQDEVLSDVSSWFQVRCP